MANLPAPANDLKGLPSFRSWFIALAAILDHPLPTYTLSRLKGLVTERAVVEQLAPMLAVDIPPRADDLVKEAWAVLNEFMTLSPNEAAYIDSIKCGEVRPELLFPYDLEAAQRIAEHPAILWKVTNVRAHLARRAKKHSGAHRRFRTSPTVMPDAAK